MKRILKSTVVTLLCMGAFIAAERLAHHKNGGFTIVNITDPHPYDSRWDTGSPSHETLVSVREILSQPFDFLAPGGQSFAFTSRDGKYVLKITKHKRMRVPLWAQPLPLQGKLEEWRQRTAAKKKRIFDATFNSYLIAAKHLPDETGIVFLHLNKTSDLNQTIQIFDKTGIGYQIEADDFAFIVQKKAELFCPHIEQLMQHGNVDLAKERIRSMMCYLVTRAKSGIEDHDHCFETNLAFLDGRPFQLDIGSLRLNEAFKSHPMYCVKLREYSDELRHWINCNYPELSAFFGELIEGMLADPNL